MVEQRAWRSRWFVILIVLALAFMLSGAGINSASAQASPEEDFLSGEILVKFEPGTRGQTISDVHRRNGGEVEEVIRGINVQVIRVPTGQEQRLVNLYERNPNVRYAEVNSLYQAFDQEKPNDPKVDEQWQYHNTGQTGGTSGADIYAFEAWDTTTGSGSVPIAILDTGIKAGHEDLNNVTKSTNFATCNYYNYYFFACSLDDNQGHGTHVAGSAAANSNNGVGVAGTCRGCSLFNAKVLDDNGSGANSWIANGIIWSADEGAKVISMSLGGSSSSNTLRDAVDYAWGKGAVLVAAAGNDNTSNPSYPAYYQNVIAVGATDHKDLKASYSNYGSWVDVAAPGSAILSTTVDSAKYGKYNGTSMSTPHVAGVAGLVWSTSPGASNQDVRNKIEASIEDKAVLSGTGPDWTKARINACKAVGGTSCTRSGTTPSPDTTKPTISSVTPADGATGVSRGTNVTATFSEAMKPDTLNTGTVTLVKDGTTEQITATVTVSSDGKTVTLDPSASLAYDTKYKATVTTGAKDTAGNLLANDKVWIFTTEKDTTTSPPGDTTAPTVSSVSPADASNNVARNTSVTATFSEAMDPATLTTSTFTLVNHYGSTTPISATVSYDEASKKVTLKPSASLSSYTYYRVTVKGGAGGAKDLAGNPLATNKVWYFYTGG